MIVLASVVFVIFMSGIQAGWFIIGGIVVAIILGIGVYLFLYQHDIFASLMGGDHKLNRFYGWVDPEGTYNDQGFQLFNAMLSYGTAVWGHGMGTAIINLPEAQTDFIFAVIALGFGFVGGGFTIAVVCVLDALLIRIGFKSKNNRDKYLTAGIFGLLIFHQVWNIGMVLGLFPSVLESPLPFHLRWFITFLIRLTNENFLRYGTRILEGKKRY